MPDPCSNSTDHQHRIRHIVTSYSLAGEDPSLFEAYLLGLMGRFPLAWIELAIVETLVQCWLRAPLVRGLSFLRRTHQLLRFWEKSVLQSRVTPLHFEMITGLDATPLCRALGAALQGWTLVAEEIARAIVPIPRTEIP